MRGKEVVFIDSYLVSRITPAYAGKSFFCPDRILWDRDHPRVCGEKLYMPCAIAPNVGSPPRMRGKVSAERARSNAARITPAYAGKSYLIGTGLGDTEDHPRVCGEKMLTGDTTDEETGSPPRMRGKASNVFINPYGDRITPAYAGKSKYPDKYGIGS